MIHPHFTPNFPANILEETQIAGNLEGIVSQDTQLKTLSIVDNVKEEMRKIEEENQQREDAVMNSMFGGGPGEQSGVLERKRSRAEET